jgi:formylglycine-generating enzyme required for sulfatase activity
MKKLPFLLFLFTAVIALPLESGLHPRMIAVAGGSFTMGSTESIYRQDEKIHQVNVRSFFLSETEVTQDLYQAVMGTNPSYFKGGDNPVEMVTWYDAVKFCNALSEMNGLTPAYFIDGDNVVWNRDAKGYRLPTEAEWEYAARGGQNGYLGELSQSFYAGGENAADLAWYVANSGRRSQPVRGKLPNQLGFYDMSGNVWEWCWDWFDVYPDGFTANPQGPDSGRLKYKVFRGGSWINRLGEIRITYRRGDPPANKAHSVGIRLAQNW